VTQAIFIILAIFVVLILVPSFIGFIVISSLQNSRLEYLHDNVAASYLAKTFQEGIVSQDWATEFGFEPMGAYKVVGSPGDSQIVAWSKLDEATYLCVYFVQGSPSSFDFVTRWENGFLATGKSRDAQIVPGPENSWSQSFTVETARENWQRHHEAQKFLELENPNLRRKQPDLENDFSEFMISQSRYVNSLFLWPLRIPYWFYVRRYLRHNKSVQQLSGRA